MTLKLLGRIDQSLDIQEDYHQNFKIKWLVETDDVLDGPYRAMNCPGLPTVGSSWVFGNDSQPAAVCWPNWTVSQFNSSNHEPNTLWVVEQPFSTKFTLTGVAPVDNPFAAPPDVSGTFVKYQEEQRFDFEGKPMHTMSFEPFRGEAAKFDANRPTVSIGMNYAELGLNVFAFMIDCVNDSPMWGLGMRMVKLSNIRWTRNVYRFGYFYTRTYDFDINYKTFDRIVPQMGTKVLQKNGNPSNKDHWVVRRDIEGNIVRDPFYYTGAGLDWDGVDANQIAKKQLKYYPQTNLFLLGIPGSF